MDEEILKTVESMLGTDIKVVDCEKTSSVREEEVLLINGIPVQIEGEDGLAIKSALMTGQVPPCDLLNQLLYRAGILRQPVQLETSLSVKSSVIRKEEVTVARHGKILNERRSETQENNIYTSSCKEVWEPVNKLGALKTIIPIPVDRCLLETDDGRVGNAFLLASPPRADSPLLHRPASVESQRRKDSVTGGRSLPPLTTASSSSSSATSASFYRSGQPNFRDNKSGSGCAAVDKSFSYTDCYRRSPLPASMGGAESATVDASGSGRIDRSSGAKTADSAKKLLNCMSFDSGHDDDFFNSSLSQSNFLSAVTGTCGSCSGFDDETHASGTPTLHSNSISSCCDFISSSDEADHQLPVGSIMGADLSPKMPSIFGTVASDQCPKDSGNRKGFPQTASCIKSSSIDKTHPSATSAVIGQTAQSQHAALSSQLPQNNVLRAQQLHDQPPHHYLHHHHHHHRHQLQQHPPSQPLNHHHHHQQQHHSHQIGAGTLKPLDSEENALVYRDGNLISGPLDSLIQHMVPTHDYYPDRSYLFAFLLSARLFIRPHELLAKICQLCVEQQDLNCTTDCRSCACSAMLDQPCGGIDQVDQAPRKPLNNQLLAAATVDPQKYRCCDVGGEETAATTTMKPCPAYCDDQQPSECCRKLRQFAQHFVRLLAEWIDTFPYDFRDERLMQHVRSMTRKCIGIDSSLRKDVQTMLQELLQRLTVLERYEEFLLTLSQSSGDGSSNIHGDSSDVSGSVKNNANTAANISAAKPASSVLTIQNNLHSVAGMTSDIHSSSTGSATATIGGQPLITSSSSSSASSAGCNNSAYPVDISQLCPSPFLLAHQLTHIELERLSYIGPEEFVQAFAKENPHLEQSFSDMKKTRNLESYVQWFNRLSYLVATEIVKHPKKKQRVRIVEYWIETARECFNIGNFNSLMAIIAGLNMSPISRLKKTWSKVQSAKFLVLEHQMDPSSNFNSYRSTLKAAMWRSEGATDERERIVIPFFSLLVKDLYFLNEGCSNKLVNGHINFEKFWQLAKQVTEFIAWKQVSCPFEKQPKVIMFLQTSCVLNENRLAIASFECEPPENNHEKERYKSLKHEQQQLQQQQQNAQQQGHHHHHQQNQHQ